MNHPTKYNPPQKKKQQTGSKQLHLTQAAESN
jgi:hypothetical protein